MIHEVIILDHGGPLLGMMLYAAALKLFLFVALVVRVAIPFDTGSYAVLDWHVLRRGRAGAGRADRRRRIDMARLRMTEIPKLLATACVLSALAICCCWA